MGSKIVDIKNYQKPRQEEKITDPKILTADCWNRFHDLIQEIPDEALREEALEFWRKRLPAILSFS